MCECDDGYSGDMCEDGGTHASSIVNDHAAADDNSQQLDVGKIIARLKANPTPECEEHKIPLLLRNFILSKY
jgi:hypothetical protein